RARWLVAGLEGPARLVPARGRLRATDAPTTGDWVAVDSSGAIAAVLPRRGTIVRRAAGGAFASQVLAANVDLVLVVEPLPDPEELAAQCRFTDCGHTNEPGCVVRERADPERVEAWKKLEREQAWIDDRRQAARDRGQLGRKYARTGRDARRAKGDDD